MLPNTSFKKHRITLPNLGCASLGYRSVWRLVVKYKSQQSKQGVKALGCIGKPALHESEVGCLLNAHVRNDSHRRRGVGTETCFPKASD